MDHRTAEAKKSHDLLSASWRPRKAGGGTVQAGGPEDQAGQLIGQSESEGLRGRGSGVRGREMMDVPAQAGSR